VTVLVVTVNVADDEPAGTVTLGGTVATALLLESATTVDEVAARLSVTRPCEVLPPVTVLGVSESDAILSGAGEAGVTVSVVVRRPSWLLRTSIVTVRFEVTLRVVTGKETLEAPAAIVAELGTVATEVLLVERSNRRPPEGATAPATSEILPVAAVPPTTVEGDTVTLP
jgi:hypothetical protein